MNSYKANDGTKALKSVKDVFKSPHLGRMKQLKTGDRELDRPGISDVEAEGTVVHIPRKLLQSKKNGEKARIHGSPEAQKACTEYAMAIHNLARKHQTNKRDSMGMPTGKSGWTNQKPKHDNVTFEGGPIDRSSPPSQKKVRRSQRIST